MQKIISLFSGTLVLFMLMVSCDKTDALPINLAEGPANTSWKATLQDGNLATNPPGGFGWNGDNQYYPWLDCHLGMTFSFSKEGKFVISGAAPCQNDDLIFRLNNAPYVYDKESKRLSIGTGDEKLIANVMELNDERMKLAAPTHSGSGLGYIVFLFKRQ